MYHLQACVSVSITGMSVYHLQACVSVSFTGMCQCINHRCVVCVSVSFTGVCQVCQCIIYRRVSAWRLEPELTARAPGWTETVWVSTSTPSVRGGNTESRTTWLIIYIYFMDRKSFGGLMFNELS